MILPFKASPNWFYRGGYKKAILYVPATGQSVSTNMVKPAGFQAENERRTVGDGTLDTVSKLRAIQLEFVGDEQCSIIRQWAEGSSIPAKVNLILVPRGRGRWYHFLEDVPCHYEPVDSDGLQSDRVTLSTAKMEAAVYENINAIAYIDFEDWSAKTNYTGSGYNDLTGEYTMVTETGGNRAIYHTDVRLPYDAGTLYFSLKFASFVEGAGGRKIGVIPLDFGEEGVPWGTESNSHQNATVGSEGRVQFRFQMEDPAWAVRLYTWQDTAAAEASMVISEPMLTSYPVAEPTATLVTISEEVHVPPRPTFGIEGSFDGSGSYVTIAEEGPATIVDNSDNTHTITLAEEAFVSRDEWTVTIKTDNSWSQP